jgi:hypothetical protein
MTFPCRLILMSTTFSRILFLSLTRDHLSFEKEMSNKSEKQGQFLVDLSARFSNYSRATQSKLVAWLARKFLMFCAMLSPAAASEMPNLDKSIGYRGVVCDMETWASSGKILGQKPWELQKLSSYEELFDCKKARTVQVHRRHFDDNSGGSLLAALHCLAFASSREAVIRLPKRGCVRFQVDLVDSGGGV